MSTPVTTLDQRFSDDGAVATGWADTLGVLETAELFWISTVRADGRPHVTPLVAVWTAGALHFCTGAEEQKALNLSGNPQVVLTTGCNGWDAGLDVMVEGTAVRVTDEAALRALADAWTVKWDGRWTFHVRDGGFDHSDEAAAEPAAYVFSVVPAKILAFAKGEFGHTVHRF
jgi:nitroimidazol reductase NimA-like FMN-containing flavoprotein (pyridoxamine 5'-phosphate oxidase superfamily)